MAYTPDPGQEADLTAEELAVEDRVRERVSIAALVEQDLSDPTTPDPTEDIELAPEGEEVD